MRSLVCAFLAQGQRSFGRSLSISSGGVDRLCHEKLTTKVTKYHEGFSDNFDAALGELRNRGVQFLTEPFANQGNRLVFFSDGDGNILHLIQRERPLP